MPASPITRRAAEKAAQAVCGARIVWGNPAPFRGGSVHRTGAGPVITIDPELSGAEVYAVLIHEVGHVLAPSWKHFIATRSNEQAPVKISPSLRRQFAEDDATLWAKRLDSWAKQRGGKTVLGRLLALQSYPR